MIDFDKGTLRECSSIPFLKGFALRNRVAKITGVSTWLANDVSAGLYGEHQLGAAVGCSNVVGIFFGTGIGGALIIDGKPYIGSTGRAGDIGHYVLQAVGSDRHEVLDNVASRTAIAAEAAALAAKQQAPHLLKETGTDVRDIKGHDLAEAVEKGDKALESLVRSRARMAGMAISNLVDFLNPDMVVLGGGLVEAMPKVMLEEVGEAIRSYSAPELVKTVKVAVTKLKDHAVTTGAAKLALDAFLTVQASDLIRHVKPQPVT